MCAHFCTLHWRHNDHGGVSHHQPRGYLLNRLFRRRWKKISKLRVTGLCAGNSPGPVKSPHKGPVTRKMLPFDDVIMNEIVLCGIFDAFWDLSDGSTKCFANCVFGLTDPYLVCLSGCKYWVWLLLSDGWLKLSAVERVQHYTTPVNRINGLWNYSLKGQEDKSWMIIHNALRPRQNINTLRPRQNGRHFTDDTFNRIFLTDNVRISIKISKVCS